MNARDSVLAAQAAALAGLGWPGRPRWHLPAPVRTAAAAALLAGGALALAGAVEQGRQLTPRIDPPDDARLLTSGAYRWSRHPVYAGLLVAGAGLAVLRRRPEPLAAWSALAAVLHLKSGLEEQALRRRFGSAYDAYAARTPRLLGRPAR